MFEVKIRQSRELAMEENGWLIFLVRIDNNKCDCISIFTKLEGILRFIYDNILIYWR